MLTLKERFVGIFFLLLALLGLAPRAAPQTESAPLEITYIANEGFLIASGEDKVLIDALQRGGIALYEAPSPALAEEMETAQGRFSGISLVLVSHHHRDHFNARSVARHLQSNPPAKLVSSVQVVEEVQEVLPEDSNAVNRMIGVSPGGADRNQHTLGGITLEIFRLSHGTGRFAAIQNLGQVFTIAGQKFLHIGDAEVSAENFAPHNLPGDEIDYAFIPYWYLTDKEGQRIVRQHIQPKHIIAMHIPPVELAQQTKEIQAAFPNAIVFSHSGATRRFQPKEKAPGATAEGLKVPNFLGED